MLQIAIFSFMQQRRLKDMGAYTPACETSDSRTIVKPVELVKPMK